MLYIYRDPYGNEAPTIELVASENFLRALSRSIAPLVVSSEKESRPSWLTQPPGLQRYAAQLNKIDAKERASAQHTARQIARLRYQVHHNLHDRAASDPFSEHQQLRLAATTLITTGLLLVIVAEQEERTS